MKIGEIQSGVPMQDYVMDKIGPGPSLSTSIVQAIYEKTPKHAWQIHPRFGGSAGEYTNRGDLGSAAHAAILGVGTVCYAPAEFQDWRKKDAQAFRDTARENGQIPLLNRQREEVESIAVKGRKALAEFGSGRSEMTMLWDDNGCLCRARADYLTDDHLYDIDIKTCENANPSAWIRGILFQGGYDIQVALRVRGHGIIGPKQRDVVFLLVEINPPYSVVKVGLDPETLELADRKVRYAMRIWQECIKSNIWPDYSNKIHYAQAPGWMRTEVEEKLQGEGM